MVDTSVYVYIQERKMQTKYWILRGIILGIASLYLFKMGAEVREFFSVATTETLTSIEARTIWGILWSATTGYVLLAGSALCIATGFKQLKPFAEGGLMWTLAIGLPGGIVIGLIQGLVWSLSGNLLVFDFIMGLVPGIAAGFVMSFIWGLEGELHAT